MGPRCCLPDREGYQRIAQRAKRAFENIVPNPALHLTGAAILVLCGMKVLSAAPASELIRYATWIEEILMNPLLKDFYHISDIPAVVVVFFSIVAAIRSGALKSIRIGPFEIPAAGREVERDREVIRTIAESDSHCIPFETEQLANYFAQVLVFNCVN